MKNQKTLGNEKAKEMADATDWLALCLATILLHYDWNDLESSGMKHFEDVWLEAEKVSVELISSGHEVFEAACEIEGSASELAEELALDDEEFDVEKMTNLISEMLFKLARICKEYNINSWEVLEDATNNAKIDLYDKGED